MAKKLFVVSKEIPDHSPYLTAGKRYESFEHYLHHGILRSIINDIGQACSIFVGEGAGCAFLAGTDGYWKEFEVSCKPYRDLKKVIAKRERLIDNHCIPDYKYGRNLMNSKYLRIVRRIERLDKLIAKGE